MQNVAAAPSPVEQLLPAPFVEIHVLELALWQWVGLLLLVGVATAVSWLVAYGFAGLLRPVVARVSPHLHDDIIRLAMGPARLVIALGLVSAGTLALRLPPDVHRFLVAIEKGVVIVAIAWMLVRLVNLAAAAAADALAARGRTSAMTMVPLGRKTAKVAMLVLTGLALLQNLGLDVTGVLAGLGIGGLAVALAAQKTIENLFGGVTLLADQPVRVGDFCRYGDRIGMVEEIGLRSTRIRTLDRTVVSIPNAEFAGMQLENFARRDKIWLRTELGLRYETTPEQIRYVLIEIRRMLYAHPRVDPEPARVRFVGFGAHSLDLEIFAYVRTTDMNDFLAVREDLFLRIMDIVAAAGTGFAFPSQTLYLTRDGGVDDGRRREAEGRVQAWREQHELHLPNFPGQAITDLAATLDYPPRGASVAARA